MTAFSLPPDETSKGCAVWHQTELCIQFRLVGCCKLCHASDTCLSFSITSRYRSGMRRQGAVAEVKWLYEIWHNFVDGIVVWSISVIYSQA